MSSSELTEVFLMRVLTLPRSAELHSAVSQIFNLLGVDSPARLESFEPLAECNSAIQQITNLRYRIGVHALNYGLISR